MKCQKCHKEKEETFFTDRNGLNQPCNDCKPQPKTKPVVVPEKVSDKPVSVKSTKK